MNMTSKRKSVGDEDLQNKSARFLLRGNGTAAHPFDLESSDSDDSSTEGPSVKSGKYEDDDSSDDDSDSEESSEKQGEDFAPVTPD